MKLQKLKTRLIISTVVGLIAVLIYNGIFAQVKPADIIGFGDALNALWKKIPEIQVFLICSVLCLTVLSVPAKKHRSKQVIIPLVIGFALVLTARLIEHQFEQRIKDYTTLDTAQVVELYEKVLKEGDVEFIAKIAIHPNLPDSIQQILSDSEIMEVRRSIAWDSKSEELLRKFSTDKEWEVRNAVATNKATPPDILKKLCGDSNEYVRNTADAMFQSRNKTNN
jgi:hypothetical protein